MNKKGQWSLQQLREKDVLSVRDIGHIASDCPNRNIVTLIEEEKEANDEARSHDEDVELIQPN